jgi:hypothetical protein
LGDGTVWFGGSERWSLDAAIMDKSRDLGAYERRGDGYMAYRAVRQALRPADHNCRASRVSLSLFDGFREDQKYGTTEDL